MYAFRSRLGHCYPFWRVTGNLVSLQPLTSSPCVKCSSNKDVDTELFGLLEIPLESKSRRTLDNVKNYSPSDAAAKWEYFQTSKIMRQSQNLIQDDPESDYFHFRRKEKGRNTDEYLDLKPSKDTEEPLRKHIGDEEQLRKLNRTDGDRFGTLSPWKNEHETAVGDEGDQEQDKYEEVRLSRRHSPNYYAFQMKKLCKERKLAEALKILEEEMPAVGAKPNDHCYQVLINACGRVGYTEKAFKLYNAMKERGLKVQPVAYTGLFNACAESPWPATDGLERARKLRQQLIENGHIFNQTTSHAMIKAFGRCGDIDTAFKIVDDMLEQRLVVTTETINFLLQACISDQESGFRHAIKVWRKLREMKLSPDLYSYNLLIRCMKECKAGDPRLTSQLLIDNSLGVKKENLRIDKENLSHSSHMNVAIADSDNGKNVTVVIEKGKESDSTIIVRKLDKQSNDGSHEISQRNIENNKESMMSVSGTDYSATELSLDQERLSDMIPSAPILPKILGKKIKSGNVVALGPLAEPQDRLALLGGPVGLLKQMAYDGVKANIKTVTHLLDSLPPDTEAEMALLKSMKSVGVVPDTPFCNMLIRRRNFRKDFEGAKDVLEVMQEHHLTLDIVTFGCLALGCHHQSEAFKLLKDIDSAGFRANLEIMAALIRNSLVHQNYQYTLEMLNEMLRRRIVPNKRLLTHLEESRQETRKAILKSENEPEISNSEIKKLKAMKTFLLRYKVWLKKSNVQLPDHPWSQYSSFPIRNDMRQKIEDVN